MITSAPPRLLTTNRRRSQAITAGVLALGCLSTTMLNPDRPIPVEICLFKRLTGLPCPTCGLTRAVCCALRGQWTRSFHYHPAGILLAAALIGGAAWLAAEAAQGAPWHDELRRRLRAQLLTFGIAICLANWVVHLVLHTAP